MKKFTLISFLLTVYLPAIVLTTAGCLLFATSVSAQSGVGLAVTVPVKGDKIESGYMISIKPQGYVLPSVAFDADIYGVIANDAAIVLESSASGGAALYPVLTSGKAQVAVTTSNGPIKAGDPITSSAIPGVGQRADTSGYILGVSLDDYTTGDKQVVGHVTVALKPGYFSVSSGNISFLTNLKNVARSPFWNPLTTLRYLLAVIVSALAFTIGILYYGRIVKSSVETLGRNPLALERMTPGILINFIIVFAIFIFGLFLAYIIIVY